MKTREQLIKEVSHQVSDYIEWTVAMEVSQNSYHKTVTESFKSWLKYREEELIDEINEFEEDELFKIKLIAEVKLTEVREIILQLDSFLEDII